jgi:hypothetical protein
MRLTSCCHARGASHAESFCTVALLLLANGLNTQENPSLEDILSAVRATQAEIGTLRREVENLKKRGLALGKVACVPTMSADRCAGTLCTMLHYPRATKWVPDTEVTSVVIRLHRTIPDDSFG